MDKIRMKSKHVKADEVTTCEGAEDDRLDASKNKNRTRSKNKRQMKPIQMVQCDYCKAYMFKKCLIMHMKTNHRPTYPCTHSNCARSFANETQLKNHLKWEHRTVACGICGKSFIAKGLKFHMRVVHSKVELCSCDVCGQQFKRHSACKRHYKMAHTPNEKVQCDICKSFLKNKLVLYAHMRTVHSGCETITCELCGHRSPNLKAARGHQTFHKFKQEMKYACEICEQRFVDNVHLMRHSKVHEQLRHAIDCPHCEYKFLSESGLKVR